MKGVLRKPIHKLAKLNVVDEPAVSRNEIPKEKKAIEALFSDKDFCAAPYSQFVEWYIPKEDVPAALELTAKAAAKNNSKED
jgi:hypothetical protein